MAEFCKECFIRTWLTPEERRRYENGQLRIIETDYNDFCEGCMDITKVVDKVVDYVEDVE